MTTKPNQPKRTTQKRTNPNGARKRPPLTPPTSPEPPPTSPEPPPSEPDPTAGRNRKAAEATIAALRRAGHLETVDSARIATLQALADAVDADPANASLWREYRATEASLREVHDETDPDLPDLTADLSTPVGNPKDAGKGDARTRARKGRG